MLLSRHLPDFGDLGVIAAYGIGSFVVGGLFFRHMKHGFADVSVGATGAGSSHSSESAMPGGRGASDSTSA